jgi:hypothetical protein
LGCRQLIKGIAVAGDTMMFTLNGSIAGQELTCVHRPLKHNCGLLWLKRRRTNVTLRHAGGRSLQVLNFCYQNVFLLRKSSECLLVRLLTVALCRSRLQAGKSSLTVALSHHYLEASFSNASVVNEDTKASVGTFVYALADAATTTGPAAAAKSDWLTPIVEGLNYVLTNLQV